MWSVVDGDLVNLCVVDVCVFTQELSSSVPLSWKGKKNTKKKVLHFSFFGLVLINWFGADMALP